MVLKKAIIMISGSTFPKQKNGLIVILLKLLPILGSDSIQVEEIHFDM